jgi:tetratricopeptide (TPR) repeat protein
LPLAEHAGLTDQVVAWRTAMMTSSRNAGDNAHLGALVALQSSRLRFADLAATLETFAKGGGRHAVEARRQAAVAYRKAGDAVSERRMLSLFSVESMSSTERARYFELMLAAEPEALIALAQSGSASARDAVANFVVEHGTADQALAAIRARGQGLPPVWTSAYTALVGLSFGRYDSITTGAFATALGSTTVGETLGTVDRRTRLAGDVWFEYGSRFGEYLTYANAPTAQAYLPAIVEGTPARSDSYVTLADFYRDRRRPANALAEYDHAATLNAARSDVYLNAAEILWQQGRQEDARARWRTALQIVSTQVESDAEVAPLLAVLDALGRHKQIDALKEPASGMVRAYLSRNGTYRADALLASADRAAGDAAAGTAWLLELCRGIPGEAEVLGAVASAPWVSDSHRDTIYARLIEAADAAAKELFGPAQQSSQAEADRWRLARIRTLITVGAGQAADEQLRALPSRVREAQPGDALALEVQAAALLHTLGPALDRCRSNTSPVVIEALTNAATALRGRHQDEAARQVMEFVYLRQLDNGELSAPILLGLAEIRLAQQDVPAALVLLRRLTLVVGDPFDQLAASGALLERFNHANEALEFRRARVTAVPWDADAGIDLARAQLSAGVDTDAAKRGLATLAHDAAAPYGTRVRAANALRAFGGVPVDRAATEIDVLSGTSVLSSVAAARPMFVEARLAAAGPGAPSDARRRLLLGALAISPSHAGIRVPLFKAELAVGRSSDAVEAIRPIIDRDPALNESGLTPAERLEIARGLAIAFRKLGQSEDAARYLRIAIQDAPPSAVPALRTRLASIDAELERARENARRLPRIGDSLNQPGLVRPRIPPPQVAARAEKGAGE